MDLSIKAVSEAAMRWGMCFVAMNVRPVPLILYRVHRVSEREDSRVR